MHSAIGLGFAFHWLKHWRDSFKPITKHSNRNRNHVITFDSHLKTALIQYEKQTSDLEIIDAREVHFFRELRNQTLRILKRWHLDHV